MDIFATIVTPAAHRADALVIANGTCNFVPQFTTDSQGTPPATHYMNSGFIPEAVVQAFQADNRFVVTNTSWKATATSLGLVRVIQPS